jgi:hypothetical protein
MRSVMYINEHAKKPTKESGRINIAILLIIAAGIVLPFFLAKGFIPMVSFFEIGIMNMLIPLFFASVGPQEKEPPDGFF